MLFIKIYCENTASDTHYLFTCKQKATNIMCHLSFLWHYKNGMFPKDWLWYTFRYSQLTLPLKIMIDYDFLCHKTPSVLKMVLIFQTISKWQKWYDLQTHDIMSLLYISELNKSRLLRCKDRTSQWQARVASVLIW